MSQKKRVRVYKPGGNVPPYVNTDHFANYMYQVGGPVQGMPQGDSTDIIQILQMYGKAKGLTDEQLQQVYTSILELNPDQQAQAISEMQQELGSSMAANPMTMKNGGGIKEIKKLLRKKVGGVSPNTTSDNIIDVRKETVANAIGSNMMNDVLNNVATEQQEKIQQMQYDYGGYVNSGSNIMGGYSDVSENPFYNDYLDTQADLNETGRDFAGALFNIGANRRSKGVKVKTKGDMFNNNINPAVSTSQQNPFFSQDVDVNSIPDYLQLDTAQAYNNNLYGMAYGGGVPSYQDAGSTVNQALSDLGVRDEDYHTAALAIRNGNATQAQKDIANKVDSYASRLSTPNTNQGTASTNDNTNYGMGLNGWHGGFFWQNGVPMNVPNMQQQPQAGFNWGQVFTPGTNRAYIPGASLSDFINNPQAIQQFGKGLTQFQPDDVYLSKAKARMNPFGAKVVLKWEYGPDGKPVQVPTLEGTNEGTDNGNIAFANTKDKMQYGINRLRSLIPGSDERMQRREDRAYARYFGNQPTDDAPEDSNAASMKTPMTSSSGSGLASLEQTDEMGNPIVPPTPTPVYAPVQTNRVPGTTLEDYQDFAKGGSAGKMVLKEQYYAPTWAYGQAISPGMDFASSLLEQYNPQEIENMVHNTGSYVPPVPEDQLGSRGTDGRSMLTGKQIADLKTQNQGIATYQNIPGYELSSQMNQLGSRTIGKYGGPTYDLGGQTEEYLEGEMYDLDDEAIEEIMKNGGSIQYINQ